MMEHLLAEPGQMIDSLRERLRSELPGTAAQLRMSPRPRYGWRPDVFPSHCRQAAGLLLVYPGDEGARLILTQRRSDLFDHGGQVSLPGGRVEAGESWVEAALREAHEEVDLDPELVDVVGPLTPIHIPVSRFVLHPIVGVAAEQPRLRAADGEVARILEPSVAALADPDRQAVRHGGHHTPHPVVPYFNVDGLEVWGATAMVLAEFLTVLGAPPDPWKEGGEAG